MKQRTVEAITFGNDISDQADYDLTGWMLVERDTEHHPQEYTVLAVSMSKAELLAQVPGTHKDRTTQTRFEGGFEVSTVRAGDLVDTDVVDLTDARVYTYTANQWRWVETSKLPGPRWRRVFDVVDDQYVEKQDDTAEPAFNNLNGWFVMLRVSTEEPNDSNYEDEYVAVHECDLVRVQRAAQHPQER